MENENEFSNFTDSNDFLARKKLEIIGNEDIICENSNTHKGQAS